MNSSNRYASSFSDVSSDFPEILRSRNRDLKTTLNNFWVITLHVCSYFFSSSTLLETAENLKYVFWGERGCLEGHLRIHKCRRREDFIDGTDKNMASLYDMKIHYERCLSFDACYFINLFTFSFQVLPSELESEIQQKTKHSKLYYNKGLWNNCEHFESNLMSSSFNLKYTNQNDF